MKKAAGGKPARSAVRAPAARPDPTQTAAIVNESALLFDLRSVIQSARQRIASAACAELVRRVQFVQQFPDEPIVVTLSQQLSWSHFHAPLPIKDPLVRDFYAEMGRLCASDCTTPSSTRGRARRGDQLQTRRCGG